MKKQILASVAVLVVAILACRRPPTSSTPPQSMTPSATKAPTSTPQPTVAPSPTLDTQRALSAIADDYPAVDGSTSALPLQSTVACHILGVPCYWQEVFLSSERAMMPPLEWGGDPALAEAIYSIWHNGTHSAYLLLIQHEADLILVARRPSEDELREARQQNVELDVRPVALDAFVFLAHADNPVESLDLDTVRAIYAGDITRWPEVTDAPPPGDDIHTYQRNPNSGSQELMEDLVMQGTPMIDSPDMILETMMGPIHAIGGDPLLGVAEEGDPLGIGYSVYFYAANIFPHEKVKMIGVDGVPPNSETIADATYPLATEVYVVVREDTPPTSTAVMLRDWLLTEEGQAVVAQSGYVPLASDK